MAQWGRADKSVTANDVTTTETSTGAPIGTYALVKADSANRVDGANAHFGNTSPGTRANTDATMFQNTTPGTFIPGIAVGIHGVTPAEMSNNTVNSSKDHPAHAGWVIRRAGTGPILSAAITTGTGHANGETITVSNGAVNATLTIATNGSGTATGASVTLPGSGWTNTDIAVSTFNREKYVTSVTVLNANAGYSNTSILRFSNGTVNSYSTNLSTNTTGGLTAVTLSTVGLFPNAITAGQVITTVTKYDGTTATGNVAVTAFTPVLANSSGGSVTLTIGGRAGRVHTETLVAMGSLGAQTAAYGTPATVSGTGAADSHYPGA
jgi:hypothetical protein